MIGETISHYKIIDKLGEGGMGVVYEAVDTKLDRTVALKFLPPESTRNPDAKARFVHEAKAASALDHNNVCVIHEIGESDDGQLFLAMARYEGETLKDRIERGALPIDEALDIARQMAEGLAKAHERDIVHRDIKPANIFITKDGVVKILDFGLAKLIGQTGMTQESQTLGTVSYMSPEQAQGQLVDHRSDLWSLGVVLYEMLTGELPFQGDHPQAVFYTIINQPLTLPSTRRGEVYPDLDDMVRKLLEKDPENRYQITGDFLGEFRVSSKPPKNRRLYVVLAILGLILIPSASYFLKPEPGVATTTVTVMDEEGQQIQRKIPTRKFRKRMAIFPFEVTGGDTNQSWLAYATSGLLTMDIIQDYYISLDLTAEIEFTQEAGKVGYPGGRGAPLTLKRQVARAANTSHFVTGSIGDGQDSTWIEILLYDTDSGRLESKFRHEGANIFEVVDSASSKLRRLLGVPEQHLHDWPDLPVTEISTDSPVALEALYRGQEIAMVSFDLTAMRRYLEDAVDADPAFAWALLSLYSSYITAGEGSNPRIGEVIEACMTHIYRLPERMQFAVKSSYFQYKSQPGKQLAVLQMWCDLYPDDNLAYEILVQILHVQGRTEEKFAAMDRLLDLEPNNTQYLTQAAEMYEATGDLDQARGYLELLVEIAPDDPRSHQALGELLQVSGRHQDARDRFEMALLLNPKDLQPQVDLSESEFQLGNHEISLNILESALEGTLTPGERTEASQALSSHLARAGQIDQAIEIMLEAIKQGEGKISPLDFMPGYCWLGRLHVKDRNRDEATRIANDMRGQFAFPLAAIATVFAVRIYVDLEDFETSRQLASELEVTIEQMRWENVRPVWERLMGRILEGESDLIGALEHYRRFLELRPTDERSHFNLGRCLRKMAEYEGARDELALALARRPSHPEVLFEAALNENSLGNRQQAVAHLDKALEVWNGADRDFKPSAVARDTLRAWSQRN